jgi:hypothetical protein
MPFCVLVLYHAKPFIFKAKLALATSSRDASDDIIACTCLGVISCR